MQQEFGWELKNYGWQKESKNERKRHRRGELVVMAGVEVGIHRVTTTITISTITKCFTCVISFHPYKNPMKKVLILFSSS